MIDYENLQARCQRGELSLCAANNLLAECRAAIGRLIAEIDGRHAQHSRDSAELRKLCAARDSARRERDQLKAKNETLRAELAWSESDSREQSAELNKLRAELASLRTGFDAQNEVIAGLRKDAERYRWLRDSSESIHQFYLSTPIWFTSVKFSKENVDSTIDAAMGKGGEA
ncbi:hypothetical protein ACIOWK_27390 [Pseudomonas protegens]|uniref:hypothetical protein n=1 Tax=Pseudomonas protegens TaxID=380021 RepID=UPI003826C925